MNPNPNFENASTDVNRAFVHLFIENSDAFAFPVEASTPDGQELQATLVPETATTESYILLQASGLPEIEYKTEFNTLREVCEETLELVCVEEEQDVKPTSELRSPDQYEADQYEYHTLKYRPIEDRPYYWNVPHLVVYGHLSPEISEACSAVFGHTNIEFTNIRNHYVVYGDELSEKHRTKLHDTMGTVQGFEDDIQFAQSQISMADLI